MNSYGLHASEETRGATGTKTGPNAYKVATMGAKDCFCFSPLAIAKRRGRLGRRDAAFPSDQLEPSRRYGGTAS
jgi:hypothetical protein